MDVLEKSIETVVDAGVIMPSVIDQEIGQDFASAIAGVTRDFVDMAAHFDPATGTLWCSMTGAGVPSFTPQMVGEMQEIIDVAKAFGQHTGTEPLRFLVLSSARKGVFNLGGNLELLSDKIRRNDVEGLRAYARRSCDLIHAMWTSLDMPCVTISVVAGDALGGGLESARSCNLLVAERGTKLGLPEAIFGLFPGMGAFSLLSRHLNGSLAYNMMLKGDVFTAEQLHSMGLVDELVDPGAGMDYVRDLVRKASARDHFFRCSINDVRRRVTPLTIQELYDVTDMWAHSAIRLTESDLKRMERLRGIQTKRFMSLQD